MKLKINPNYIVITGFTIGIAAAAAQAFFDVQPPQAYGVCLIGHPSILVKWFMNHIFGMHLPISTAFLVYPSLLVAGITGGALFSSIKSGEFKTTLKMKPASTRSKFNAILFGFLVQCHWSDSAYLLLYFILKP